MLAEKLKDKMEMLRERRRLSLSLRLLAAVAFAALSAPAPAGAADVHVSPLRPTPGMTLRLRGGAAKLSRSQKKLFQELSKQAGIFSAAEPGEHQGREDKHVPTAILTETGVDVVVKHVMDDGQTDGKDLHYIEFIWLIDQDTGECLAAKNLLPGDGVEATASFKGSFKERCVVPFAMCNLHGTWKGEYIGTPKAPVEVAGDDREANQAMAEAPAGMDTSADGPVAMATA